jgi:hypothetical protein
MIAHRVTLVKKPEDAAVKIVVADKSLKQVDEAIIYSPKLNQVYCLKGPNNVTTQITFAGNDIEELEFFDVRAITWKFKGLGLLHVSNGVDFSYDLVSGQSIPWARSPRALYGSYKDGLYLFKSIKITISGSSFGFDVERNDLSRQMSLSDNESLQKLIQSLIQDRMPKKKNVKVGRYPVFLPEDKKRPTYEFLNQVYREFLAYNDETKLDVQSKNSDGFCHMRAHFSSLYLEKKHGIQTFKVFEYWEKSAWSTVVENKRWWFHCAAIIVDNKNQAWCWDPWVCRGKTLPSLQDWVFKKDHPCPNAVTIVNSMIINPDIYFDDTLCYGVMAVMENTAHPNFMETCEPDQVAALHEMTLSAMPQDEKAISKAAQKTPATNTAVFLEHFRLFSRVTSTSASATTAVAATDVSPKTAGLVLKK